RGAGQPLLQPYRHCDVQRRQRVRHRKVLERHRSRLCDNRLFELRRSALWTNRYNGGATAIALDRNGNVFVTGTSFGSAGAPFDYATIAYSSAGVPLWTNRFNGFNGYPAMAVDSSGNVFVAGTSAGISGTVGDFVTIKYS